MPRMLILSRSEIKEFDSPPIFSSTERKKFFALNVSLKNMVEKLLTPSYKISFFISNAYFSAKKRFFLQSDYHVRDIEYASQVLGFQPTDFIRDDLIRSTLHRQKTKILQFHCFEGFNDSAQSLVKSEIDHMVNKSVKPKQIFLYSISLLTKHNIEVPSYDKLSKLILASLNERKAELNKVIDTNLSHEVKLLLDDLLTADDNDVIRKQYELTTIKKVSHSIRPSDLKEKVADFSHIQTLYKQITPIVEKLKLSSESIKYYANIVIRLDVANLNRYSKEHKYLHLISFIAHQYHRLHDNLGDIILNVSRTYQNTVMREYRELCYEKRQDTIKA